MNERLLITQCERAQRFCFKTMASILANIEAALTRVKPGHKVPFHLLWLYVLDPPSEYLVHVETLAGIRTTLETLTPTSAIRHVQCAYRAAQLVKYLATKQLVVPPSFGRKVAGKLYKAGYVYEAGYVAPENFWTETFKLTNPELLQAIKEGPTDFTDTFAVQLCALSTLDTRVQLSTTSLGQLGLKSNVPLTLTVTIRADRASYDATLGPSAATNVRLTARNDILAGWEPLSSTPLDDRPLVYDGMRENGYNLRCASAALRNDRDIVLAAVQQAGCALQFASAALRNDRDIVLAAVQQDGLVLEHASMALRNDRELVLAAVQQAGYALEYASAALQKDRDIVLAAVQQDGLVLEHASMALQNDRELVLAAVQQYGCALEYASAALKNDREVVLAAVQRDGYALKYASSRLQACI
jgi:predicted methyltransferase